MGRHKKIKIETITIEDNGLGMTKKDLKTKFMKVGTGSKLRETISPILKRRVSGEKGMGHYSVQRLGDHAIIRTTPTNYPKRDFSDVDKKTLSLELDWIQYSEGKEFEKIGNKLQKFKKEKIVPKIAENLDSKGDLIGESRVFRIASLVSEQTIPFLNAIKVLRDFLDKI